MQTVGVSRESEGMTTVFTFGQMMLAKEKEYLVPSAFSGCVTFHRSYMKDLMVAYKVKASSA